MRVFLTGVSCVGKTTIGGYLAVLLGRPFFDLDHEIEGFFGMPLQRLQDQTLTMYSFRESNHSASEGPGLQPKDAWRRE